MEDCTKALEFFYNIDEEEYVLEHFTALSILKERATKRAAMRIKSMWYDYEIFPISLYYTTSDAKTQEKKIMANFHDCILQLFNQVNRIKFATSQDMDPEQEYEDEMDAKPQNTDLNLTTTYQNMKGRNFSLYFTNGYLYFTIYRHLFERNINKLSQLFLTASIQELMIELGSVPSDELRNVPISTYITLWRVLSVQGAFPELQQALFRFIVFKSPESLSESMILLSFLHRENQVQENLATHVDFILNFMTTHGLENENDKVDQEKIANYVLQAVGKRDFIKFSQYLPEFREFLNKDDAIAEAARPGPVKVCPTEFWGNFFPENDLCYMENKMEYLEHKFFEDFVESLVKGWVEKTRNKTSEFEEAITEPIGIKSLSEDFYSYMSSNVGAIERDVGTEDQIAETNIPKFTFKSYQQTKSEFVDYSDMRDFIEYLRNEKAIRFFQSKDLLINMTENMTPDYLAMDNIIAYEGYLQSNNQRCSVFKVDVIYVDHLDRIKKNIDIMNLYSPLVVKYLGLYIPTEFDSSNYSLYFVTDWWFQNINDYVKMVYKEQPKEIPEEILLLVYRMLYFMHSCKLTSLLVPVISPYNIYIGKNGYPQFLIPFFSAAYYCPKAYYKSLYSKVEEKVTSVHYFHYPNYEGLPDTSTILLRIRTGGNKLCNLKFNEKEEEHIQASQSYTFTRMLLYLLSGQIPLWQTKPTTVGQLLQILKNDVKSLPTLQKQVQMIKKKANSTPMKNLVELLGNIIAKPGPNSLIQFFEKITDDIPYRQRIRPSLEYNIDTLNAAYFIENSDGGLLGVPLRRVILLPCKLVFNGYLEEKFIESGRFYQTNNLLIALNLQDKESEIYSIDCFLDEKRTLNLKTTEDQLDVCTYFIKSSADAVSADVSNQEKTIQFDQFYQYSWVHSEVVWTKTISPFIKSDIDDGKP